jgi:mannose-6-phosphate isomerase-like protein (cupin superfamily)
MSQGQSIRDASHLYEVERRVQHAARPGFRIMELQLSPTQKVPWHSHTNISDTFYVLEGHVRLFLQDPKEEVNLKPGEVYVARAARPHLVTNGGTKSLTFLTLQGVGDHGAGHRKRLRQPDRACPSHFSSSPSHPRMTCQSSYSFEMSWPV